VVSGGSFDRMATLRYATASDFGEIVTAATRDMTDVMTWRGPDRLASPRIWESPASFALRSGNAAR